MDNAIAREARRPVLLSPWIVSRSIRGFQGYVPMWLQRETPQVRLIPRGCTQLPRVEKLLSWGILAAIVSSK